MLRRLIDFLDDDSQSVLAFAYCAVFGSSCMLAVATSAVISIGGANAPLSTGVTLAALAVGSVLVFTAACTYEAACRERSTSRQPSARRGSVRTERTPRPRPGTDARESRGRDQAPARSRTRLSSRRDGMQVRATGRALRMRSRLTSATYHLVVFTWLKRTSTRAPWLRVSDGRMQMESMGRLPNEVAAGTPAQQSATEYIAEAGTPSEDAWAREWARYGARDAAARDQTG
jgi:hypothetical protein